MKAGHWRLTADCRPLITSCATLEAEYWVVVALLRGRGRSGLERDVLHDVPGDTDAMEVGNKDPAGHSVAGLAAWSASVPVRKARWWTTRRPRQPVCCLDDKDGEVRDYAINADVSMQPHVILGYGLADVHAGPVRGRCRMHLRLSPAPCWRRARGSDFGGLSRHGAMEGHSR